MFFFIILQVPFVFIKSVLFGKMELKCCEKSLASLTQSILLCIKDLFKVLIFIEIRKEKSPIQQCRMVLFYRVCFIGKKTLVSLNAKN